MVASRRSGARLAGLLATAIVAIASPSGAAAQAGDRAIAGRVILPTATGERPVPGAWVVLHRVARDTAGPLDSMRTARDGGYHFRYRATDDTTAIHFVSTNRGGIAYFTAPTREATVRGDAGELVVYDTTSAALPIRVRGRHVIVTAADTADRRTVIEVYELSNDTILTRIARGRAGSTFEAALPPGVDRVGGGDGDVSPDAIRAEGGRVRVNAPLAPGLKRLSFFYEIPADDAPLELLVDAATPVLEVLIEDAGGRVEGAGLAAVEPVNVEGRPFRRFLAQDVAGAQTFRVIVPASGATRSLRLMLLVVAVGAALLLGLGAAFLRGGPAAFARRRESDPESLALEIAALDARFDALAAPTEQQKAEHFLARARLKGRLADALAKRDGLA